MGSTKVLDQIDSLIDDLLNDTDLSASSLASMLMAARDSVRDGYHVRWRGGSGTRTTTSRGGDASLGITGSTHP